MTRTRDLAAHLVYHSELGRFGNQNRRYERPCAAWHNFAFVFNHVPGKRGHRSVTPDSKPEVTKCGYCRRYIYVCLNVGFELEH
jgi:hypothetical protein